MIVELTPDQFPIILPLLEAEGRPQPGETAGWVAIHAVIQGTNRGRIFVDDASNPKTALIWCIYSMYYLLGDDHNPAFNQPFPTFYQKVLAPANLALGATAFIVTLSPDGRWTDLQETLFCGAALEAFYRWTFEFDPQRFLAGTDRKPAVPAGYEVRRIDQEMAASDPDQRLLPDISDTWESLDRFLSDGMGYCIVHGSQIVTSCISCFSWKHFREISIRTYDPHERGRGFGSLAAGAFVSACLEGGLIPDWDTDTTNLASISLAERVGFVRKLRCPAFETSFPGGGG